MLENVYGKTFKAYNLIMLMYMMLQFGFKYNKIAGANQRFGMGQACIYTKFPIDIKVRLEDLQNPQKLKVKNIEGIFEEVPLN
uniref:Uncharacterized protein n=1 Tax=Lepeophtheirus salmonis TaxID=72036 RepID=A0A0K2VBH7_LEPSM